MTEQKLIVYHKGNQHAYPLTQVKDLTLEHRKAMLYLLLGGIGVPFTAVAFYRDFLKPWPTLILLFTGIFALYVGWMGYRVLTVHQFAQRRDFTLSTVSENLKAFVQFTVRLLPVNIAIGSERERMIYHVTDQRTWKEKRDETHFKGRGTEGFIHASDFNQLPDTLTKYFKGKSNLLLLTIDPLAVHPEVRFEDLTGEGRLYPHIYGDLNLDAIRKIETLNLPR